MKYIYLVDVTQNFKKFKIIKDFTKIADNCPEGIILQYYSNNLKEFAVFSRHQIVVLLYDFGGELYQIVDKKDLVLVYKFNFYPDDSVCDSSSFDKNIFPIGKNFIGIKM